LDVEFECVGHGNGSEEDGAGELAREQLHLVVNALASRYGMQNTIIAKEHAYLYRTLTAMRRTPGFGLEGK
jgi:hypothetical protein